MSSGSPASSSTSGGSSDHSPSNCSARHKKRRILPSSSPQHDGFADWTLDSKDKRIALLRDENTTLRGEKSTLCKENASLRAEKNGLELQIQQLKETVIAGLKSGQSLTWDAVPEFLRSDLDLIMAGVRTDKLDWHALEPASVKENRQVVKAALSKFPYNSKFRMIHWNDVPQNLREDEVFCEELCHVAYLELIDSILRSHATIAAKRSFWLDFIESLKTRAEEETEGDFDIVDDCLRNNLPRQFRSDFEIMLGLCRYRLSTHPALWVVQAPLTNNRQFYEVVLDRDPTNLSSVDGDIQRLFPDLVQKCIDSLGELEDLDVTIAVEIANEIPREFWNREFCIKWLRAGLPFVGKDYDRDELMPSALTDDKEIFLLVAKHCRGYMGDYRSPTQRFSLESYKWASPKLLQDKPYVLEVVQYDPVVFQCLSINLQQDLDVASLAFSTDHRVITQYLHTYPDHVNYGRGPFQPHVELVRTLRARMKAALERYDTFRSVVLMGMSASANSGSDLELLDQGPDTALIYKRRICDFLDIPSEKRAHLMRRAHSNIQTAFFRFVPYWWHREE